MKKLIAVVLISGLLLCTKTMAGNYVIGVESLDYMPYYSGINNEYQGYARELIDAFAENNGHTFTYKALPVRRLFKSLLNKSIDFKFPDHPNWQSDLKKGNTIIYSNSTLKTLEGVVVLPGNKGKGLKHLKKLGTVMGFTPWGYKESIDKGEIIVSENPNFQGLLKQVIRGRVSGAYINPVVADYQLTKILKKPGGTLVFDSGLPFSESNYLLSTIKHKDLIESFNKFLLDNKGFIKRLKTKYNIVEKE